MVQITGLYIYPVKSIAGIACTRVRMLRRGLEHDRRFMLVTPDNGVFISQRSDPRLAHVVPRLEGERLILESVHASRPLALPLRPERGEERIVDVWDDRVSALSIDDGGWFASVLGRDVRLVYMPETSERCVDPRFSKAPGDIVSFADGYPTLIVSEASLAELNRQLDTPVDMRRFRPNIVVSGCEPHAEDTWPRFRAGTVTFSGVKTCSRCILTTVDPDTAQRSPLGEPLATLAEYRKIEGRVIFGMNLLHDGPGVLNVGDEVEVLEGV